MGIYDTTHLLKMIAQTQMAAREALKTVLSLPDTEDDERGCHISLRMEKANSFLIDYFPVGAINRFVSKKIIKEQINRLLEMHVLKGHVSSHQSMDLNQNQLPGAILGKDQYDTHFAYGCYGFKNWQKNEAMSLIIAIKMGHLRPEQARKIAIISNNEIFVKTLKNTSVVQHKTDDTFGHFCAVAGALTLTILIICAALNIG